MTTATPPRPVVLCILDGWGYRKGCEHNAICLGRTPNLDRLAETGIRFENVTTGKVLWEAEPELDEEGKLAGVPIGKQFLHLGDPLSPEDTYRLTVEYDNPTGETIPDGGMGSIGGIFLPSKGVEWPRVDPEGELYQLDLRHYYRELLGKLDDLRAAAAGDMEMTDGSSDDADHEHHQGG